MTHPRHWRSHYRAGLLLTASILAATALTRAAVAAEFQPTIDLVTLDGQMGFKTGPGKAIASAGDVNGDGFDDFIIGDPGAGFAGTASGAAYVVFGDVGAVGPPFNLSSLDGKNGFRLLGGAAGDAAGRSVSGAGDVNHDGFDDNIVGAPGTDQKGLNTGAAYVVFGKAKGFLPSINLATLTAVTGFRLDGEKAGDYAANSVSGAGDVNGDGFADVILKAPGADPHGSGSGTAYVVFGRPESFGRVVNLAALAGPDGFRIDGESPNDSCTNSGGVASAGDFNGDGFDDLIMGFPCKATAVDGYHSNHGSAYIVFGKASGFVPSLALSSLTGVDGFRIDGGKPAGPDGWYDGVGSSVSSAADVNGDGFDDVVIGQYCLTPECNFYSDSYVVFGKASGFGPTFELSALNGQNGFRFFTPDEFEYSNIAVSGAGDVNGDGFTDVMFGEYYAASWRGAAYVVFGKPAGFTSVVSSASLNGVNGFQLLGGLPYDAAGAVVAGVGDINGDGFADMGLTADSVSYLVYGRAPDSARVSNGSAASQYISGGSYPDTLKSKSGWDVVEGRGEADNLVGGPGSDLASYGHAPVGVRASLASPATNTGDADGDTYSEIEGLIGSQFADRLIGDAAANRINGGLGRDVVTGGPGGDIFGFDILRDSRPGPWRDVITDFEAGSVATSIDKINLRNIDAMTGPGDQAFRFIATAPFSNAPGELRVQVSGTSTIVMGDVNGDAVADVEIELQNFSDIGALTARDFMR
jgi:hypothetical protein